MTNLMEMYIAEYNFNQKCFHIETIEEMAKHNLHTFQELQKENVWMPIYVGTYEDCKKATHQLRNWVLENKPDECEKYGFKNSPN